MDRTSLLSSQLPDNQLAKSENLTYPDGKLAVLLTVCLFAVAALSVLYRLPFQQDVGDILDLVRRGYGGERLYFDILEPNPPLIFYLYRFPAYLADLTHSTGIEITRLYLLTFAALSVWLCHRVLHDLNLFASAASRLLFTWLLILAFIPLSAAEFGQREHLSVMFTMPYFLSVMGLANGRSLSIKWGYAFGAVAAVGIALKPYFLPLWLLPEAYLYLVCKNSNVWRRPENQSIIVLGAAYAVWVIVGTGYLDNARLVMQFYGAYNHSFNSVFAAAPPALWITALVLQLALFRATQTKHIRAVFSLTLLSYVFSALVQKKGWSYHWLPAQLISLLLFSVCLLILLEKERVLFSRLRLSPSKIAYVFGGILIAATLFRTALTIEHPVSLNGKPNGKEVLALSDIIKQEAEGKRVAWFSTGVFPMFPALTHANARQAISAPLFFLPEIYIDTHVHLGPFPYHLAADMSPVEQGITETVLRNFTRNQPALVVFDRRANKQPFDNTTFDFEEYFSQDPRFSIAMEEFTLLTDFGQFRIYKRKSLVNEIKNAK